VRYWSWPGYEKINHCYWLWISFWSALDLLHLTLLNKDSFDWASSIRIKFIKTDEFWLGEGEWTSSATGAIWTVRHAEFTPMLKKKMIHELHIYNHIRQTFIPNKCLVKSLRHNRDCDWSTDVQFSNLVTFSFNRHQPLCEDLSCLLTV